MFRHAPTLRVHALTVKAFATPRKRGITAMRFDCALQ